VTAESSLLLLASLALVIYFGPAVLRLALKPEKGSVKDLRIAWFETFLNDVDKRGKITEKLQELGKQRLGLDFPVPPPPPPTPAPVAPQHREPIDKEAPALGDPSAAATKESPR
jgi:hypothetical protein